MKIKAPVLPLISAIVLGVISLMMPWLVLQKYQDALGQTVVVERYLYYLWGHSYTVYGKEDLVQTIYINYIQNIFQGIDFPLVSMVLVMISISLGLVSFLGGRGTVVNLRGKQIMIRPFKNPILMLIASAVLPLLAWYYLQIGTPIILDLHPRFEFTNGPANDFMLGSSIAYALTALFTYRRTREERLRLSKKQT